MKATALVSSLVVLIALFAANARYVYSDALKLLPRLTADHLVDPRYVGATFRFEGRVTGIRTTRQGILLIELHHPGKDVHLDAPVFPSLGCLPVKPLRGDNVLVTGNLGMYGGQPQLRPLSAAHVELVAPASAARAMGVALASTRFGETLRVGPLKALDVEPFVSRRGLQHVRLTLADARVPHRTRDTVQGVMFQGDRTACEVDLLRSGASVAVTAIIDRYRGRPSLNVKRVVRVK